MIAYRAETMLAGVLGETVSRTNETRSLLREICATEADLLPDEAAETLTVRLHHLESGDRLRFREIFGGERFSYIEVAITVSTRLVRNEVDSLMIIGESVACPPSSD